MQENKRTRDGPRAELDRPHAVALTRISARTLGQAVVWAIDRLHPGSTTPRLDAELLMAHLLGISRASVLARVHDVMKAHDQVDFEALVGRRASGEPVAYLLSSTSWWDLELTVSPAVLIPRPDTEVVLERALSWIRGDVGDTVVDVGTGSGAIAIAIARLRTNVLVHAIDVSPSALLVADMNVRRYGLHDRVRLVHGNLLEPVAAMPSVIVANLPYLSVDMMSDLAPEVRAEPELALFGGNDGLDLYRSMFQQYRERDWNCPMVCEIDPRQTGPMVREINISLPNAKVQVSPDLAGRDRVVEIWN